MSPPFYPDHPELIEQRRRRSIGALLTGAQLSADGSFRVDFWRRGMVKLAAGPSASSILVTTASSGKEAHDPALTGWGRAHIIRAL